MEALNTQMLWWMRAATLAKTALRAPDHQQTDATQAIQDAMISGEVVDKVLTLVNAFEDYTQALTHDPTYAAVYGKINVEMAAGSFIRCLPEPVLRTTGLLR